MSCFATLKTPTLFEQIFNLDVFIFQGFAITLASISLFFVFFTASQFTNKNDGFYLTKIETSSVWIGSIVFLLSNQIPFC